MKNKAIAAIDALLELETEIRDQLCGGNALDAILDALRSIQFSDDDDNQDAVDESIAAHERAVFANPEM